MGWTPRDTRTTAGSDPLSPRRRDRRWWGHGLIALAALMALSVGWGAWSQHGGGAAAAASAPLADGDLATLAFVVREVIASGQGASTYTGSERLRGRAGPVFAALRAGGVRAESAWASGPTTLEATTRAVAEARRELDADGLARVDSVELCLSHSYRSVDPEGEGRELLTNAHVGVLGIEIDAAGENGRYSPTLMLANNWTFADAMERFAAAHDLSVAELTGGDARVRVFGCDQVLVTLADSARAVRMERGNQFVPLEAVTGEAVTALGDGLGAWLTGAVHDDGRMTYKYWPSRGEESDGNNMIRQWMATIALNRLAAAQGDPAIAALAARNIRYNLDNFYREENGLGLIDDAGSVKLGAVALAALAIVEHPQRAEFAREEAALRRTVVALWQEDGSFRTFYEPADRNDNQNFYPGEALLLWATLYAERGDPALLARFMTSFDYYRVWHLDEANRNPAFVPWHTQAYYLVWRETEDPALRDFIFEMNDWLLGVQQWETAPYPDMQGRFYDPARAHFGPPHASSTGVYLEGLVDAYRLAVATGDEARADQYRLAIRRGLRSIMQLQFTDEIDLYYISQRARVLGGVRTTEYDNEIRVDNVQHTLMGVLKIQETFAPADYIAAAPAGHGGVQH